MVKAVERSISSDEDRMLTEILDELGIERSENYIIAVDGKIVHDRDQSVSGGSRILVVPVVAGG